MGLTRSWQVDIDPGLGQIQIRYFALMVALVVALLGIGWVLGW